MLVAPNLVCEAVAETRRALRPRGDADWSVLAADLDRRCWKTGVHIADDLVFYASQIIDQPQEGYVPFEVTMVGGANPEELLRTIGVCGAILERTVAAARPGDRGYHVYGTSDVRASLPWASSRRLYTPTTSPGDWGWTGFLRPSCALRHWRGCSLTHCREIRLPPCGGALDGLSSTTARGAHNGAGMALSAIGRSA